MKKLWLLPLAAFLLFTYAAFADDVIVRLKNGTSILIPYDSIAAMVTFDSSVETKALSAPSGTYMSHEYVDLGLSVKWATCNIGAANPWETGLYYRWGEATLPPNEEYGYSFSYAHSTSTTMTIMDISGNSRYDAATYSWGGGWRVPTPAECEELLDSLKCEWAWTSCQGVNGYKITSLINGNSIFLPASGKLVETSNSYTEGKGDYVGVKTYYGLNTFGYFWASSQDYAYEEQYEDAFAIFINSKMKRLSADHKRYGLPIRPVF